MYNDFFGFKEGPFQLVPNPGYFFMGRSHEEAIAHLTRTDDTHLTNIHGLFPALGELLFKFGNRFEKIRHQAEIRDLEDRGFLVLVDGDDGL